MMHEWVYHSFAQPIKATFREWDITGNFLRGLSHTWVVGYYLRANGEDYDMIYMDHAVCPFEEIPSSLYEWTDDENQRAGSFTRITPQAFTDLKEL